LLEVRKGKLGGLLFPALGGVVLLVLGGILFPALGGILFPVLEGVLFPVARLESSRCSFAGESQQILRKPDACTASGWTQVTNHSTPSHSTLNPQPLNHSNTQTLNPKPSTTQLSTLNPKT
jgi:hypothetical protein